MNFFYDSNLTLQEAINYYINYVKRHNGVIAPEFENGLRIEFVNENISESLAVGNASTENNIIRMRKNSNSIVTLFHEMRHLSDQWQEGTSGKKFSCWEYETDFTQQMTWEDQRNNVVNINRGIHGRYMDEAIAELYASKVYWELCGNSAKSKQHTAGRTTYDEEIINLKKICVVLGISEDTLINLPSENDFGRNILRKRCKQLTGNEKTWDILEDNLDYIEMEKVIKISHSTYRISQSSQNALRTNRQNVKNIYDYILTSSLQRGIISNQEYNSKIQELADLDKYIGNGIDL